MTLQTFSKTAQIIPANQVVEGTSALVASAPPCHTNVRGQWQFGFRDFSRRADWIDRVCLVQSTARDWAVAHSVLTQKRPSCGPFDQR